MSARDAILTSVRNARLSSADRPAAPLPDVRAAVATFGRSTEHLVERFTVAARETAIDVVEPSRTELSAWVRQRFSGARDIVSLCTDVPGGSSHARTPRELANVDLFVCEASFGVAENGAVWLPASRLGERAALFLATDVLVVLSRSAIVEDVHAAYSRIAGFDEAFGIFVAGPSKTADIEQSLVIGAHGPKGMTVALV